MIRFPREKDRRGAAFQPARRVGDGATLTSFPGLVRRVARPEVLRRAWSDFTPFGVSQGVPPGGLFLPTPPRENELSVAILGAGNGGLALAGYLAQQGHQVALWNRSAERIAPVAKLGGIRLTLPGSSPVVANIRIATSDMGAAVAAARLVLVAVPASAHADIAEACAPHLRDGQTVLLLPGRTGGALAFRRKLHEAGCHARIFLGEANTFPLAARNVGPAAAVVFGAKSEVRAAALPARRTAELLAAWRPLLPMLRPARSVLHTGLANVGAILHPIITLLNAGRIARAESFDFYTEGVTSRVAAVLAAADTERIRVARAFGVATSSLQEWIATAYCHHANSVQAAVGGNPAYVGIKAPVTLEHRYLLEDVPTGMIPLIELADAAGVAAPMLHSLVDGARSILGIRHWERPRTLEALGLKGLDPAAIRYLVEHGRHREMSTQRKQVPAPCSRFVLVSQRTEKEYA
jgi:opine dehydrogenase